MKYLWFWTVVLLLPIFRLSNTQANMLLVESLPQLEGSMAISGDTSICRSRGEAAYWCVKTEGCRGAWFYDDGQDKICQAATCPAAPGKLNQVPGQIGFFLRFTGIFTTVPEVKMLMDSNTFTISTPSGDLTPTVDGTVAPSLVQGKVGSAVRLERTELNYGQPAECFYDVRLCTSGLTGSLWVKFFESYGFSDSILDGGGFNPETKGMSVFRLDGNLQVNIFDDTHAYITKAYHEDYFDWHHLAFTWVPGSSIVMYLNGCPAGFTHLIIDPIGPLSAFYDYRIASNEWGGEDQRGDIALDHVLIWYHPLTPEDVWQLYMQGGQI